MQWGPQYFGGVGSRLSKVYRSINITLSDLNLELHRSSLKGKNGFFLLPHLSGFNVTFRKILICDALCWSWTRFSSIKFIYWWLDRRKATGRTDASIHGWSSSIPTGTESSQCSFQQSKTNISDNQTLFFVFFFNHAEETPACSCSSSGSGGWCLAEPGNFRVAPPERHLLQHLFNLLPLWTEGPTLVH